MTLPPAVRRGLTAVGVLGLLVACGPQDTAKEVEFRVPVSVEPVGLGSVEDRIIATGTLRATEVASLQVYLPGVLEIGRNAEGRRYGEGDRVEVGETIAEITGEDVRIAASTAANRQRYEAAKREAEAIQKLDETGLVAGTELQSALSALEDAKLEYDRSLRAEKRRQLTTPIDGVILKLARDAQGRPLASGQLVAQGVEVAQIAPIEMLIADVDLIGSDVARVSVGLPGRLRHHAWEGREFTSTVIRLAPMVDPVTRALRAELEVDNREGLLRPGMFVEVSVIAERREGVPVVPREAVASRGGKWVVFVLEGQRVVKREVTLGLGDDEIVEIRAGVQVDERVVVRGLETLADQTRVRVAGSS